MKKTRLAATLSLSLLVVSVAQSAQYEVVELPLDEVGANIFPTAINAEGKVTVNVQNPYNAPIDISLLDFESEALLAGLTDPDGAKSGDINASDYAFLYSFIASANASGFGQIVQQIASTHSYLVDENTTQFISGFDQLSADTNAFTFSTNTNIRGLNDLGDSVGSGQGLFRKVDYTNESDEELTYVVNDFRRRAFATINDRTIELAPIDTTVGGVSVAYGINNSRQVVGFGTVENATEALDTAVDTCNDEELRGDVPVESCFQSLRNFYSQTNFLALFQTRGLIWQLDALGNIIDTQELGLLFTPEADDESVYASQAFAINNNGIAVGLSSDFYQDSENVLQFAAIFEGDNVTPITSDEEYFSSTAVDINNLGQVVGHGFKNINGTPRSKFFVHDINLNDTVFPDDFFQGSASVAKAINDNGIVVGFGQIDFVTNNRRNEGFIYDHNTQVFQNVNDLLECDSPYNIEQANNINNANEITATAVVSKPARNILTGEILLDDDGSEILVEKIVAVKLLPIIGGNIDECEDLDAIPARKGASLSYFYIVAFLLLGIRRKYK